MITIIKVVLGFLFVCFLAGLFFYTILDPNPWRRDSQPWDPENGPAPVFHRYKKIAQRKFFNRTTWNHIKSYYMYYGLALIMIAVAFTA